MERYTKILDLYKRLIQNNCHIIFDKGALLKDNKNDKNVLQLQFLNIGNKQVKAVYVTIECLSIEDELLEAVEFEYLDLTAEYGDAFGSNIPVTLHNSSCRKFNFSISKILYEDSSVMLNGRMEELPVYDDLADLGSLKDQFVREVQSIDYKIVPVIKPTESHWCWHCTCGNVNYYENDKCGKCGINKERLFSLLNVEYLSEKDQVFLEDEENKRRIEAENIALRKEKNKRKIKIAIIGLSISLAVCIIMSFVATCIIIPQIKYKKMEGAVERARKSKKYEVFHELRNTHLTSKEIELAYRMGNECIENNEFEDARNFFYLTKEYDDGGELYKKASYLFGLECMENKEFKRAIDNFKESDGYGDAEDQIMQSAYMYGLQCMEEKDYTMAILYLKKAGELGNEYAEMRIKEAKYEYIKQNLNAEDEATRRYLLDLKKDNYKDTNKIYDDLFN